MSNNKVSAIGCTEYDESRIYDRITQLLEPLGGMGAFVPRGKRVLVKPNMLSAAAPGDAVTTHPTVVKALVRLAREAGAGEVWVGDSPATASLDRAMERTGIGAATLEAGGIITAFDVTVDHTGPQARIFKSIPLAKAVLDADVIISAAKLKTHGLTSFTGAVKNLYGCIPGHQKAQYHLRAPGREEFGNLIVDICETVRPVLFIIDGVVGMEGAGPRNGTPKEAGVLLASADGYALDAVASHLIGLDPKEVPYLLVAHDRGLLDLGEIPELSRASGAPVVPAFKLSASRGDIAAKIPKPLLRMLQRNLTPTPKVDPAKCTGCGVCKTACPPSVINIVDRKARLDLGRCIRCYCCQELCPNDAVDLKEGWLLRTVFKRR